MFEVEQKFPIADVSQFDSSLIEFGFAFVSSQSQCDIYFNHPCRDFASTKEALRVRRIDGAPFLTYKGTKLPGAVKARRELEWELAPGDIDGNKTEELLILLGFRRVAEVRKHRRTYEPSPKVSDSRLAGTTIVIDEVEQVGRFVEIERIAAAEEEIESAREEVARLAERLGLREPESRSYLTMLLGH